MKSPIKIMVVDQYAESENVRATTLGREDQFSILSRFDNSEQALLSLEGIESCMKPDIILFDFALSGHYGYQSIVTFRSSVPEAKIIVHTRSNRKSDVLKAVQMGAFGYLLKPASKKKISECVHAVARGEAWLDAEVAQFIVSAVKHLHAEGKNFPQMLSRREMEILSLLAEGLIKKEIAGKTGISYSTVCTHVGSIFNKLDVKNAPEAVHKAHCMNLFPS